MSLITRRNEDKKVVHSDGLGKDDQPASYQLLVKGEWMGIKANASIDGQGT